MGAVLPDILSSGLTTTAGCRARIHTDDLAIRSLYAQSAWGNFTSWEGIDPPVAGARFELAAFWL